MLLQKQSRKKSLEGSPAAQTLNHKLGKINLSQSIVTMETVTRCQWRPQVFLLGKMHRVATVRGSQETLTLMPESPCRAEHRRKALRSIA